MLVITLISWGSWATVIKKCGNWRFEAFYFDFVWSGIVWSLLLSIILGGINSLHGFSLNGIFFALFAGVVSGFGNILLVNAITLIGFASAFPIAIGISLILGTTLAYLTNPSATSKPTFLFAGLIFVALAVITDGLAYRFKEKSQPKASMIKPGILIAVIAGILISLSAFPFNFAFKSGINGYQAVLFLSLGQFLAAAILLPILMKKPIVPHQKSIGVHEYLRAKRSWHLWAVFGGLIWAIGTLFYLVAASQPALSVAIAYTFGQCAPMVAALWGIFVWKEFKGAPQKSYLSLGLMFLFYLTGIIFLTNAAH